ncbi:MotA/TolQ/ExbB proton channel family protein [Aliifodinibius sp. S!AR15-10]|uniref:MotA/TolQ/ExbB proton channel family protein n=1 Tax=Aliifodinibius sp. S!AR15-10 TaxID=2950437 RepID=UPI00285C9D39|nr:MotA/TolQ/ExbB proton channel family protein [Aliifodinibius sp. S!AR15-10]MDR8392446.1 MotA/TolQ/ExbB proton channel family protein [Aliifodinibius sp. S!AR15-10]
MIDLFYRGGPLFMSLVSLAGLLAFGLIVYVLINVVKGKTVSKSTFKKIPIAGSLAFVIGILGQAIGLYDAMGAIQAAGDVSPALVAGGFQVSMIAPLYGLVIFAFTLIFYLVISLAYSPGDG